jgi:hypothetical protein
MLTAAAALLGVTTLFGFVLIALGYWIKAVGLIWAPGAAHGAVGLCGYAILLVSYLTFSPVDPKGFMAVAVIALTVALFGGLAVFGARLRRREPSILVLSLHATLGATGVVLLFAFLAV